MHRLISILVVAGGNRADRALLEKAVMLARRIGAQIHLFSCDAQLAHSLRHSCDPGEAEQAWNAGVTDRQAYLESLRAGARPSGIHIAVEATCDGPLCDVINRKALECNADLVMKSPSGAHPLRGLAFDTNDWQLMRTCPVALMLVRERMWHQPPQFAALVDMGDSAGERVAETIVHTSRYLALGCKASLDLIFSDPAEDQAIRRRHARALASLASEHHLGEARTHVVAGDPHVTLAELIAPRDYDVILLGALTHRRGFAALVGTLTNQLVEKLGCDFVLVKRKLPEQVSRGLSGSESRDASAQDAEAALMKVGAKRRRRGGHATVLWQSLFGD